MVRGGGMTEIAFYQQGLAIGSQFDTTILAGTKSPNTIQQYRSHFAAYVLFAASWGNALQPATLARWRQNMFSDGYQTQAGDRRQYSVSAINQRLASVRSIMAEAAQQNYISYELAEQFRHIKGLRRSANKDRVRKHARTAISAEDMARITESPNVATPAGKMHRALLMTLAECGMRISEAVALKVADIQWQDGEDGAGWVAWIWGKNMDEAEARPLGKRAKAAIDSWLRARDRLGIESPWIFTSFGGRGSRDPSPKPMTRVSAWQMVQRYAAKVGLEHIKPHDFRRFVGTKLAKRDIRIAQKQLGHKSIETTARHYVIDGVALGATDNLF